MKDKLIEAGILLILMASPIAMYEGLGQVPYFADTKRCLVPGPNPYYVDCPTPEQAPPPSRGEKKMKFTIVVAIPVSRTADGLRSHVQLETHELSGYSGPHARVDAEAAVRRACSNRCDIRSVTEEEEK